MIKASDLKEGDKLTPKETVCTKHIWDYFGVILCKKLSW